MTDAPRRVLFLPGRAPVGMLEAVRSPSGQDVEVLTLGDRTQEGLRAALAQVDVVVGDWSGTLRLGPEEAAAATRLRLVQQPGTGVETIDLPAFARRGIPVASTGSVNAAAVAEWCLGATTSLLRPLAWADARVREGGWPQLDVLDRPSLELGGRRVGIVGAGEIARRLSRLVAAFGCEVATWSRRSRVDGVPHLELPRLFARSSVLVVAIARGPETLGLVDDALLARLPADAVLVDVSRGGIVDHEAVVRRLRDGALAGAALDVFETEPLALPEAWRDVPGLLLSPHVAGTTREAMVRTDAVLAHNLAVAVTGGRLHHVVNGVEPTLPAPAEHQPS